MVARQDHEPWNPYVLRLLQHEPDAARDVLGRERMWDVHPDGRVQGPVAVQLGRDDARLDAGHRDAPCIPPGLAMTCLINSLSIGGANGDIHARASEY